MRSEAEMFRLILEVAASDERIRAVILNGSRANPKARKDRFQDYDVVYFVTGLDSFLSAHDWVDVFGRRLIMQMPEQMSLPEYPENSRDAFSYLMLFEDRNRIDLTLFPVAKLNKNFVLDSLSRLLLDKDGVFRELPPANESDYLIQRPNGQQFADVCNEFWWVTTYVAKGLRRDEIAYAKDMLEGPVRKMFMKMIEWDVGRKTDFSVNFGSSGKNLEQLVEPRTYQKILATYPDAGPENIWNSLFLMTEIFSELSKDLAARFGFDSPNEESLRVVDYLRSVRSQPEGF